MARLLAESLSALLLEHADLRPAALAVHHAQHFGAANKGRACQQLSAVFGQKQNLVEGDFLARLGSPSVELDGDARRDLDLTTPGLDDCVHKKLLQKVENIKV